MTIRHAQGQGSEADIPAPRKSRGPLVATRAITEQVNPRPRRLVTAHGAPVAMGNEDE